MAGGEGSPPLRRTCADVSGVVGQQLKEAPAERRHRFTVRRERLRSLGVAVARGEGGDYHRDFAEEGELFGGGVSEAEEEEAECTLLQLVPRLARPIRHPLGDATRRLADLAAARGDRLAPPRYELRDGGGSGGGSGGGDGGGAAGGALLLAAGAVDGGEEEERAGGGRAAATRRARRGMWGGVGAKQRWSLPRAD